MTNVEGPKAMKSFAGTSKESSLRTTNGRERDRIYFDSPAASGVKHLRVTFLDRPFVLHVPNVETVIIVEARQLQKGKKLTFIRKYARRHTDHGFIFIQTHRNRIGKADVLVRWIRHLTRETARERMRAFDRLTRWK